MSNKVKLASAIFHPLFLIAAPWGLAIFLYTLKWSALAYIPITKGGILFFSIFAPFTGITLLLTLAPRRKLNYSTNPLAKINSYHRVKSVARFFLIVWLFATAVEIIYSKGVPIFWYAFHTGKTYADFGIPSIHGLLNSLISATCLLYFFLYIKTRFRNYLLRSMLIFAWGAVAVTRELMMVSALEFLVLYMLLNGVTIQQVFKFLALTLVSAFLFGLMGSFRTGNEKFIELALPTAAFPRWMPTTALWIYIYIITPLLNLLYTTLHNPGGNNIFPVNTLAMLFPTVIRDNLFHMTTRIQGLLVSQAFNVSTAFPGAYLDAGYVGIATLSASISFLTTIFWAKRTGFGVLIYSILAQCLILSIFFNQFFYLPDIFQIAWLIPIRRHLTVMHHNRASQNATDIDGTMHN